MRLPNQRFLTCILPLEGCLSGEGSPLMNPGRTIRGPALGLFVSAQKVEPSFGQLYAAVFVEPLSAAFSDIGAKFP